MRLAAGAVSLTGVFSLALGFGLASPSVKAQNRPFEAVDTSRSVIPALDTVAIRRVTDGVVHYELEGRDVAWTLDVVEVELRTPGLRLEMAKADDALRGYERTSSMAARHPCADGVVWAAVNGDFYASGGIPVNLHVGGGRLLRPPSARDLMLHSEGMGFHMGQVELRSAMLFDGDPVPLATVNGFEVNPPESSEPASDGSLHLRDAALTWAERGGALAENAADSSEIKDESRDPVDSTAGGGDRSSVVLVADEPLMVNRVTRLRVLTAPWDASAISKETLDMGQPQRIPDHAFVLTGLGRMAAAVRGLAPGDVIGLAHRLIPTDGGVLPGDGTVRTAVGGSRTILLDGENRGNWPERHPRTAVGFNADTSRFYMVTVDGRQESSVGMTLVELAGVMKAMGVWTALNLDGGGSTTMVVAGKVVNSPSDRTGERTVANALLLVGSGPVWDAAGSATAENGLCFEPQDAGRGSLDP